MSEVGEISLVKVTDKTLVMFPNADPAVSRYIWRYKVTPAKFAWLGLGNIPTFTNRLPTPVEFDAFSISEVGNPSGFWGYGIATAHIPAGLAPTSIPIGQLCIAWSSRDYETGSHYFFIINTQAVTGTCT